MSTELLSLLRSTLASHDPVKAHIVKKKEGGAKEPFNFNTTVREDCINIHHNGRGADGRTTHHDVLMKIPETIAAIKDYIAENGDLAIGPYVNSLSRFPEWDAKPAAVAPPNKVEFPEERRAHLKGNDIEALVCDLYVNCVALKQAITAKADRTSFHTQLAKDTATDEKYLRVASAGGREPLYFKLSEATEFAVKWLELSMAAADTDTFSQLKQLKELLKKQSDLETKEVTKVAETKPVPRAVQKLLEVVKDNEPFKRTLTSQASDGSIVGTLSQKDDGDWLFSFKGRHDRPYQISYANLSARFHLWSLGHGAAERAVLADLWAVEKDQSVTKDYQLAEHGTPRVDTASCFGGDAVPRPVAMMTHFERVFSYVIANSFSFKLFHMKKQQGEPSGGRDPKTVRTFIQMDCETTPYITIARDRGESRSPEIHSNYFDDVFPIFLEWLKSNPSGSDANISGYYGKSQLESLTPEFSGCRAGYAARYIRELPEKWQQTIANNKARETTTMEPKPGMPAQNSTINVRTELTAAAMRSGSRQLVKTAQPLMAAAIAAKGGANGPQIAEFLQTDLGREMLRAAMAAALSGAANFKIPGLPQEHVAALAAEFRVETAANLGEMFADVFLGPLRDVVTAMIASSQITVEAAMPVGVHTDVLRESDDLNQQKGEVKAETKANVEEVIASVQEKIETGKKGRH